MSICVVLSGLLWCIHQTRWRWGNHANFDGDGFGDACDDDADNDGLPAVWEQEFGLNDLNPGDAQLDSDGDGFSNLVEFQQGTNLIVVNPDCNRDGSADARDNCVTMAPILSLLSSVNVGSMFSVEEGSSPGATIFTISDDKPNFDYVIEQLLTGDGTGLPLDPPPTPTIFASGNSGSDREVIIQTFISEQTDLEVHRNSHGLWRRYNRNRSEFWYSLVKEFAYTES